MSLPAFTPIHTSRMTIRLLEERDLQDLLAINGDSEVTRFLPYSTWQNMEDAQAWYARTVARCADGNAQQVVLVLRETNTVIGSALLFRYEADSRRAEIGYVLGQPWWRQGLTREAMYAICDHAFKVVGVNRLEAEVDIDNTASNAVVKSLGFTHEGTMRERWINAGRPVTTHKYGLLAAQSQ